MNVYVGCPIDHVTVKDGSPHDMLHAACLLMNDIAKDVLVYNPLTAWFNASMARHFTNLEYIHDVNNSALSRADICVFLWTGACTFGVPLEIAECARIKKPCLIWNTSGKTGLYMRLAVEKAGGRIVTDEKEFVEAFKAIADMTRATSKETFLDDCIT